LCNETRHKKAYFVDTVDSQKMHDVLEVVHHTLRTGKRVLINVISKSGGTTETIANFEVFFKELALYDISMKDVFVLTTNKHSALWNFGIKNNIPSLEIPALVGGRYSVFSPAGLFPLAVLGVDVKELIRGACSTTKICTSKAKTNLAMASAISQYAAYKKGFTISETFVFGTQYESLGKWYRQLMGESLGKEHDVDDNVVWNGMTPTVAVGSTDLHSMAQLYLGGPKDKFVSFVLPESKLDIHLPKITEFDKLVPHIQGKSFSQITDAIVQGIQAAFIVQKRPFSTTTFSKTPFDIGAWLQFKMFEIMYLARLMNVNPFDQPNVEEYKIITKKVLSHK
jgi:glucose-6-phosphate isomerase